MTDTRESLGGDIYYETRLPVLRQLEILRPSFEEWIGVDYMRHYDPTFQRLHYGPEGSGELVALGLNASYGKSSFDNDRFHFRLTFIVPAGRLTEAQYLRRMTRALELLWSQGIPTCTPGWADELPNAGGEDGPVEWPPWGRD